LFIYGIFIKIDYFETNFFKINLSPMNHLFKSFALIKGIVRVCNRTRISVIPKDYKKNVSSTRQGISQIGKDLEITKGLFALTEQSVVPKHNITNMHYGLSQIKLEFEKACEHGHLEIVKLMIDQGATNWNNGLYIACKYGHLEIVKLMIEQGATDWNTGLEGACYSGNIEIVKLMIEQGATDWNYGLYIAFREEHMEIIHLMINNGAETVIDGYDLTKYIMIRYAYKKYQ